MKLAKRVDARAHVVVVATCAVYTWQAARSHVASTRTHVAPVVVATILLMLHILRMLVIAGWPLRINWVSRGAAPNGGSVPPGGGEGVNG